MGEEGTRLDPPGENLGAPVSNSDNNQGYNRAVLVSNRGGEEGTDRRRKKRPEGWRCSGDRKCRGDRKCPGDSPSCPSGQAEHGRGLQ
jgi:hypothetical protein